MRRAIVALTVALAFGAATFSAEAEGEVACPECGEASPPEAAYCIECGAELAWEEEAEAKFCPYCGAENVPDAVYCNKCGKRLPEVKEKYAFCPYCGEAVGAEDTTCSHCGETIAVPGMSHTRGTWPRNRFAASLDVSGWFGWHSHGSWGAEMAVFFSEHLCAGVKFNKIFHPNGEGSLFGLDMRLYFSPYSRGFFLKPYGKGEIGSQRRTWITHGSGTVPTEAFYFRLCGGVDFRIVRSFVAPYMDVGLHYWDRLGRSHFVVCGGLRAIF